MHSGMDRTAIGVVWTDVCKPNGDSCQSQVESVHVRWTRNVGAFVTTKEY